MIINIVIPVYVVSLNIFYGTWDFNFKPEYMFFTVW
jgi:hypothetical protein